MRTPGAGAAFAAVFIGLVVAASALAAPSGHEPLPPTPSRVPLAYDTAAATELFPNQSLSGTLPAGEQRIYKVFANRSLAPAEILTVSLEASGGSFAIGGASLFDPEQVLVDEVFTNYAGQVNVSNLIVPQTGYYLVVVFSSQVFVWSLTVNFTFGGAAPNDNDNDLANATRLSGSGALGASVTDWSDLFDTYAFDLTVHGATADALLINLTSPGTADLDLYMYHLVGGTAVLDSYSTSPYGTEYAAVLATANRTEYVRVLSYAGSSAYGMTWSTLNATGDDNGVPSKAAALATGTSSNNLSRWDVRDFFRLDVPAGTTVNITAHTWGFNATSREPNLEMVLWNESFGRVSWSFNFDPEERIHALLVEAGTYYLDIYAASGLYYLATNLSFDYTLDVRIDPPPALLDPAWNATLQEDTPASFDLGGVIPAQPSGEPVTYRVVGVTGSVSAVIGADGQTLTVAPAPDWSGPALITVEATDRFARRAIALPISVAPVNDAPRSTLTNVVFPEDGSAMLVINDSVTDPEGDSFAVLAVAPEPPLAADAVPGGLRVFAPADYHGVLWLNLTVEDAIGAQRVLSFAVTIFPVNDPPVFLQAVGPFELLEDAETGNATFSLAGVAADPDGDPVTFMLTTPPGISVLIAGETLVLSPVRDLNGDFAGSLAISDGQTSAANSVTIRILPVDDAPLVIRPTEQLVGHEGANFSFAASATDIDTPLGELRYSFWLDGARLVENASSPAFSRLFGYDDSGFHVLRVAVRGGSLSDGVDLTIFVAETNRAPTAAILTPRDATFTAGGVVTFSARAHDPDATPVNITWVIDGRVASTSATFSLEGLAPGEHSVVLLVSDGEFTTQDAATFKVTGGAPAPGLLAALAALAVGGIALTALRSRRP